MTKKSKTIVFFGSGPVAARSLELLAQTFTIEAVVTKPRPAHHKGDVPVLTVAETLGLPIITAAKRTELSDVLAKQAFESRVAVLIDFGIIVGQDVIDRFPLGIVNSHFSLLPQWRGADPITFSILSGQKTTGVSLMLLVEAMDEGPIIAQGSISLDEMLTTPELTNSLIALSYALLKQMLPEYIEGKVRLVSQEEAATKLGIDPTPTYSRKLTKEDSVIDWSKPAIAIEREIRAFAEWPKSKTKLGEIDVVITSSLVDDKQIGKPGEYLIEGKQIFVQCGDGSLEILSLKPAGKNEMTASAFLAGYQARL